MKSFSKGFNPEDTLTLVSARQGMTWKDMETGNNVVFRSPLIEVVRSPTPAPGKGNEYSMALRVHEGSKASLKHKNMFQELSEAATRHAIEFMLNDKNSKRFAKKTFDNQDEFTVTKFWYDDGIFYMRFRGSVSAHSFDAEATKKEKESGSNKKVYKPVRDDVRRYLGIGSLISVDFIPTAFFYQKKNTLYPFSLNIEKIVIWSSNENKDPDAEPERTVKKHRFLQGYALGVPDDFKLSEDIEIETDVPVHPVDTFSIDKYSLSRVIDGEKGPIIFARYGDSFGPTYFIVRGATVKWDISPDPEYGSRSLVLADCNANRAVIDMVASQFSKLVDTVTANSEKLLGSECDRETVEESISNPLYSQKDDEKTNPRVALKLPREAGGDKPVFRVFLQTEEGKIEELDMGDTCDAAEPFIGAGTVLCSMVFSTRPVIVNSQVYLSSRVEQVLVDPNANRVFTPRLNGFPFPGYDNVEIERSSSLAVPFTGDNYSFTKYDENKKSFSVLFESEDGHTSEFGILPTSVNIPFDIGLINDPENNEYPYKNRFDLFDKKLLEIIRGIDTKVLEHCTENSKEIFGSKKNEKVVSVSLAKGKLEKYSKSDVDKENPYGTMKVGVYEKNGLYNIDFEAYRLSNPVEENGKPDIQKILIEKPEDLLEVFYAGSNGLPVLRIQGKYVDKRIILSTTVHSFLMMPADVESDVTFADTVDEDVISAAAEAQKQVSEPEHEEVKEPEPEPEMESTPEPEKVVESTPEPDDFEESDDGTEEEDEDSDSD